MQISRIATASAEELFAKVALLLVDTATETSAFAQRWLSHSYDALFGDATRPLAMSARKAKPSRVSWKRNKKIGVFHENATSCALPTLRRAKEVKVLRIRENGEKKEPPLPLPMSTRLSLVSCASRIHYTSRTRISSIRSLTLDSLGMQLSTCGALKRHGANK